MISKKEKLEKILDYVSENNVSAYIIAKNTKLTEAGIGKILNKSSKNPRNLTVDAIYNYLFSTETKEETQSPEAITVDFTQMQVMFVPLVSKFAYAGYLDNLGDDEYFGDLPKVPFANDVENKGDYLCFEVKEIASKLFRSYHTIAFHVKKIRLKNGLKNIAEITREFCLAHGDPRQYIKTVLLIIQLSISFSTNDICLINNNRTAKAKTKTTVQVTRKY